MDSFNGQQIPQISSDPNSQQRNDHYLTDPMTDMRGHYSSGGFPQMRRPNVNNSPINESINELTKQTNMLSFGQNETNYHSIGGGDMSNSPRSWGTSESKEQSPQSSMSGGMTSMASNLSPFAKEFVPRSTMSYSSGPSVTNGMNWTNPVPETKPGIDSEDFVACSYLREFIDTITFKPSKYETGIEYLTEVLNTYIDEDDCVPNAIVNSIVDQAIFEPQFRYNGVRLCIYLIDNLMVLSPEKEFKNLLFRRCQREYSRKDSLIKQSPETRQYLRGLTMFIGDLFSRLEAPAMAQFLPQLLLTLLSKPEKENLKCVYQVLKLCGSLLELFFNDRKADDMTKVLEGVKTCIEDKSVDPYVKELMTNILELQRMGWNAATRAPTATASVPVVNPYLEANPTNNGAEYYDEYNNYSDEEAEYLQQAASYDFGQCGDEEDNEVCEAFEEFLKNSGQTK